MKLFSPIAPPTLQKHVRRSPELTDVISSRQQNIPRAEVVHLTYTASTITTVMRTVRLPIRTIGAPFRLPVHVANEHILRIEELQPRRVRVIVGACNNARGLPARGHASIIFDAANATLVRAGLASSPLLLSFL